MSVIGRRTLLLATAPLVRCWTSTGATNEALVRNLVRDERLSAASAAALLAIDRANFVLPEVHRFAYEDRPLPIGHDVTISVRRSIVHGSGETSTAVTLSTI